jgi:hypothetical protein
MYSVWLHCAARRAGSLLSELQPARTLALSNKCFAAARFPRARAARPGGRATLAPVSTLSSLAQRLGRSRERASNHHHLHLALRLIRQPLPFPPSSGRAAYHPLSSDSRVRMSTPQALSNALKGLMRRVPQVRTRPGGDGRLGSADTQRPLLPLVPSQPVSIATVKIDTPFPHYHGATLSSLTSVAPW